MPQGPIASVGLTPGGAASLGRLTPQGALAIAQGYGKYYTNTYGKPAIGATAAVAGASFRAANAAAAALTAALATTYTGICLSNPAASTVNLVVQRVSGILGPDPATAVNLGLITGWSAAGIVTHTTPITGIISGYVGAATASGSALTVAAQGLVDAACTLVGTPVWDRWITSLAASGSGGFSVDIDGEIIIPPGGYCAVGNLVAVASGFLGSFSWSEIAP